MINRIFLHWTAGNYDQLFRDYHICIDGNADVHQFGKLEEKKAHTWLHNSNSVGIALCCGFGAWIEKNGIIHWGEFPPTEDQVYVMAKCVYEICQHYGLPINKDTVMTHAEIAEIDGYGINSNDPDMRWDLLRLPNVGGESGGEVIRRLAAEFSD